MNSGDGLDDKDAKLSDQNVESIISKVDLSGMPPTVITQTSSFLKELKTSFKPTGFTPINDDGDSWSEIRWKNGGPSCHVDLDGYTIYTTIDGEFDEHVYGTNQAKEACNKVMEALRQTNNKQ
ncbi:hypothetical protein AKO1_006667 [Acrasis kona]|uniref:Uncharacterized protein n=1 Tax=Acrasis kona TaxID=1008807 RepID=A0AAW2ZLN0_9EUKA